MINQHNPFIYRGLRQNASQSQTAAGLVVIILNGTQSTVGARQWIVRGIAIRPSGAVRTKVWQKMRRLKLEIQHLHQLCRKLKHLVIGAPADDKSFIIARLTHKEAETAILALDVAIEDLEASEKHLELFDEHLERIKE